MIGNEVAVFGITVEVPLHGDEAPIDLEAKKEAWAGEEDEEGVLVKEVIHLSEEPNRVDRVADKPKVVDDDGEEVEETKEDDSATRSKIKTVIKVVTVEQMVSASRGRMEVITVNGDELEATIIQNYSVKTDEQVAIHEISIVTIDCIFLRGNEYDW